MNTVADIAPGPSLGQMSEPRRPYVGAHPFSDSDKLYFFGRDREAKRLANLVAAGTLTVVYGESGVGKTSLLNARLPDELESVEPDWSTILFSEWQPGFEAKLYQCASRVTPAPIVKGSLAPSLLNVARETDNPIVFVLDQFEEYFLYHPEGTPDFEVELAALCNVRRSLVRVVLSLRSDGLFLLDRLRSFIPDVYRSLMLLEPLDTDGATDAVVRPLEVYNQQQRERDGIEIIVPERDSDVVQALVRGAEKGEIRRRLRLRSGGQNADPEGASHIVAPFLQLALETVWEEDVVRRQGKTLTIETLRKLACVTPADNAADAVGRLAQAHVDRILGQFDVAGKRVCSKMFEHMVTSSGAKIAVKPPDDFEGFLGVEEQAVAQTILMTLANPGRDRLLRKVAPGPRFEIVHDALGVPILDWVTRWRQEDIARLSAQETRRRLHRLRWRAIQVGSALSLLALLAFFGLAYRERVQQVRRLDLYASSQTGSDYRLPLLLLASSLSSTDTEPWRTLIGAERSRALLRQTLLRSPIYGGTQPAASTNSDGSLFIRIEDKRLRVMDIASGRNVGDYPLPGELMDPRAFTRMPDDRQPGSRIRRLAVSPPMIAVGFVAGLTHPVLYWRGLVFYLSNDDATNWHHFDLADSLPDTIKDQSGWIWVDFAAESLQVGTFAMDRNSLSVLRIRSVPDAETPFAPATFPPPITWEGRRAFPALSPLLSGTDPDRFAFLQIVQRDPMPGQYAGAILSLGSLQTPGNPTQIQIGTPALPSDRAAQVVDADFTPSTVAFSDDWSAVVVRQIRELRVVRLGDPQGIGQPKFQAPPEADSGPAQAGGPIGPTMAAIEDGSGWHFAWFKSGTIALLDGAAEGGPANLRKASLLPGTRGAQKLNFSRDGQFLILQQYEFGQARQTVRIWGLAPARADQIGRLSDAELIAEACRIADTDANGHKLSTDEMITWLGSGAQPCRDHP